MIRVAIVEDEKDSQECLKDYMKRYEKEQEISVEVTVFQDGMDIVENYKPIWDIIFMDIKMKHMDGMKAAEKIRTYDCSALIIFITTMAQYAIKGYEVDAFDFILKPIHYGQFSLKFLKALNTVKKKEQKYLILPVEDRKERVSLKDILYIEVKNHNLHIVTENQIYKMRYSMQDMEQELQDQYFARCSNSYLVNLRNVTGIQKETILVENYELPISRSKKKQFLQALSDYLGAGYQ